MTLQSMVRWFLPREDHFYDFLEQQAVVAHEGAIALAAFSMPDRTADSVRSAVQEIEHKGDKLVHEMEDALAKTFVTPIDREDLQRLSAELDDIIDLTNGAARACALMGVERPTEPMTKLMDNLVECTLRLKGAIPKLRKHAYAEIIEESRLLKQLEKDADVVFRSAVSALFHDPNVDAKVLLREREVLEDLENAIDTCETVAETLTHLSVKNG
jgi:uncharacterized protein